MPKLPKVTAREAERAILRDGWYASSGTGSHQHYSHPTKAGRVTIARHAGQIIAPGTLLSIIRQAGLTVAQFRNLL
jgi:predicted RNA binding protein YcfA (HicA-like mRNA interferase family)